MKLNDTITVCLVIQDGSSCLYAATESGHTQVVDVLLKNAANPNQVTVVRVGSLLSNIIILLNVKIVQYMYPCVINDYAVPSEQCNCICVLCRMVSVYFIWPVRKGKLKL